MNNTSYPDPRSCVCPGGADAPEYTLQNQSYINSNIFSVQGIEILLLTTSI
jgi:hypothetical protein